MGSPIKAREWEKTLTVKCRLCGGAKCKRCSESAALAKTDSPVLGLHADWVTDRVLGMMRPSSRLMRDYKIAQQFHKLSIAAVFNLTLPGEHPYCGDGLVASGFPYDPENDLMAENIRFFNFGWEDMTTPALSFMMDIVKVMASVLLNGHQKVAVHCHAGYGRTGIAIACALIFIHNLPPDRAIKIVRRDRPGSVQTSDQAKFVHSFYEYINASSVVFSLPFLHDRFTIARTVEQQNLLLHGEKCASPLPKIIDVLCSAMERGIIEDDAAKSVAHSFVAHLPISSWSGTRTDCRGGSPSQELDSAVEEHVKAILAVQSSRDAFESPPPAPTALILTGCMPLVSESELFPVKVAFNVGEWNWPVALELCAAISYFPPLLLDWLEHLSEPLLSSDMVERILAPSQMRANAPPQAYSDSSADAAAVQRFKPLHQLPACVIRSLDRIVICLRILQAKLAQAEADGKSPDSSPTLKTPLFDAVCVRVAMAIFQVRTQTSAATIVDGSTDRPIVRSCADFLELLVAEWLAPKRLELNLDSLERLRKTSSLRKLHTMGNFSTTPFPDAPTNASPRSQIAKLSLPAEFPAPAISAVASSPTLEPVQISRAHAPELPSPQRSARKATPSPQKSPSKTSSSPLKSDQHSPRRLLPPASSSPIKTEGMSSPRPILDTSSMDEIDLPSRSGTTSTVGLPASAPSRPEKNAESVSPASEPISADPGPGIAHSSSGCSLPSVRGVERYRKFSVTTGSLA